MGYLVPWYSIDENTERKDEFIDAPINWEVMILLSTYFISAKKAM
jgi:hypothetical protein